MIIYLKTYYVDDDELIVAKWAGHKIVWISNMGLRTTSSTEAAHRKVKGFLRYGFGNIVRLLECVGLALEALEKALVAEESKQINDQLVSFKKFEWLGDLRTRCAKSALEKLITAFDIAKSIHTGQSLKSSCHC